MDEQNTIGRTYKEVWVFLHALPENYREVLPPKLLELIENQMDTQYEFEVKQTSKGPNLSRDALSFIAALNLEFWADEDERRELYQIYSNNQKKADLKSYQIFMDEIERFMERHALSPLTPEDYAGLGNGCSEAFSVLKTLSKSILAHIPKSHLLLIKINRNPKVQPGVQELYTEIFPEVSDDCMKILADTYCRYLRGHHFTVDDLELRIEIPRYFAELYEAEDAEQQNPKEHKLDYYKKLSQDNE